MALIYIRCTILTNDTIQECFRLRIWFLSWYVVPPVWWFTFNFQFSIGRLFYNFISISYWCIHIHIIMITYTFQIIFSPNDPFYTTLVQPRLCLIVGLTSAWLHSLFGEQLQLCCSSWTDNQSFHNVSPLVSTDTLVALTTTTGILSYFPKGGVLQQMGIIPQ